MSRTLKALVPVAAVALVLLAAGDALACPNCKTTAAETSNGAKLGDQATGLTLSIYLMLGVLFSLVGGIVFVIVRAARRFDAAQPTS